MKKKKKNPEKHKNFDLKIFFKVTDFFILFRKIK